VCSLLELGGSGTLYLLLTQRDVVKLFLVRLLPFVALGTVKYKAAALSKLAGAAIIWSERHADCDCHEKSRGIHAIQDTQETLRGCMRQLKKQSEKARAERRIDGGDVTWNRQDWNINGQRARRDPSELEAANRRRR
jgi:hypothetical protein